MIIKREIFPKLKRYLKQKEILALIGARQVGKTTLMKELYKLVKKESIFISFEDLEVRGLFENDIKLFIQKYVINNKYLFIDEFQYAKDGGQKLKFIYDSYGEIKIIISGSSHPELAVQALQYLVGRIFLIEIYPLSFKEFINYKNERNNFIFKEKIKQNSLKLLVKQEFEEYLKFGGYPKIVISKTCEDKKEILKQLVNSYLLKEIKDILGYKNIFEFEKLLKRIAIQDGKLLNKDSFSRDLGINSKKINEMLYTLDRTYIISLVQPFFNNKTKELIKSPKTIIQDLGFKNQLLQNFADLEIKQDKGEIYENFIYNELQRLDLKVQFWNERNRYEMDFVIEKDGKILGFEVKSKLKNSNLTNSTKRFIELFNPNVIYILNENLDEEIKYKNTKIFFTNYINFRHIFLE